MMIKQLQTQTSFYVVGVSHRDAGRVGYYGIVLLLNTICIYVKYVHCVITPFANGINRANGRDALYIGLDLACLVWLCVEFGASINRVLRRLCVRNTFEFTWT